MNRVSGIPYSRRCGAPVLAVCGFSGAGKTTLLEAAIPALAARGLAVAVVKHDAHGFEVDRPGKDSDRLFRAGATVVLRGSQEQFQRRGGAAALSLEATLADLGRDHDLVLVEGHKQTPLPKLWMGNREETDPPAGVTGVQAVLPWNSDRRERFLDFVDQWLPRAWTERPICLGLSLSAGSGCETRNWAGDTTFGSGYEQVVCWGGSVQQAPPRATWLAPPPDLGPPFEDAVFTGGVAPLMAAHRWAPQAAWIVLEEKSAAVATAVLEWLSPFRRPGVWAVLPKGRGLACALYEPQALAGLERRALEASGEGIDKWLGDGRVVCPELPGEFGSAMSP